MWAKALNRHIIKRDIHMTIKHKKRCSTSIVIRGMKHKATMRHHCTPVRMAKTQQ